MDYQVAGLPGFDYETVCTGAVKCAVSQYW